MDTRKIEKTIVEILERWERECESFFDFPTWYPKQLATAYRTLLWHLLREIQDRRRDFSLSWLRAAIDEHRLFIAELEAGRYVYRHERDASGDPFKFAPLEGKLITELARYEHGAGLTPVEGLHYLADQVAAFGYGQIESRRTGGVRSGRTRNDAKNDRVRQVKDWVSTWKSMGRERPEWVKEIANRFTVSNETARSYVKDAGCWNLSSATKKTVRRKMRMRTRR